MILWWWYTWYFIYLIICRIIYFYNNVEQSASQISVISDDVEEISKEIKDASNKYTYVITSGGIGPTHDDVTYEGKHCILSNYIVS